MPPTVAAIVNSVVPFGSRAALNAEYGFEVNSLDYRSRVRRLSVLARAVVCWRYDWADGHVRGVGIALIRDGRLAESLADVKGQGDARQGQGAQPGTVRSPAAASRDQRVVDEVLIVPREVLPAACSRRLRPFCGYGVFARPLRAGASGVPQRGGGSW